MFVDREMHLVRSMASEIKHSIRYFLIATINVQNLKIDKGGEKQFQDVDLLVPCRKVGSGISTYWGPSTIKVSRLFDLPGPLRQRFAKFGTTGTLLQQRI